MIAQHTIFVIFLLYHGNCLFFRSEGKYGFIDKVIDGIYVHINSVSVKFNSTKFHASLQVRKNILRVCFWIYLRYRHSWKPI
jgi:hypothetical protein